MEFLISGVTVNPILLAAIGFLVGTLGGFFGVGGGFLAAPMMFWAGVPMQFVVGTDLAHMTGGSIVASRRHHKLGHVDLKLGLFMVAGTLIGVEIGARIIEGLERRSSVDLVIGVAYIFILLLISTITAIESLRAIKKSSSDPESGSDTLGFNSVLHLFQRFKVPPMVSFPVSGVASISIWVVIGLGFLTGLLAGTLGVGGGFVRLPMLVYALGVPTHVAVGTDLFEIIISAGYGTLTHAIKGNVDVLMALTMQTGAAIGARIGVGATRYVSGIRIRLLFSVLPLIGALMVLVRLISQGYF